MANSSLEKLLRDSISGKVVFKGDDLFRRKISRYWNRLLHTINPLGFVEVHNEDDVITAVKHCVENKVPLCVVSGGHGDVSLAKDTLVIDMKELRTIKVDTLNQVVITEPGALIGSIDVQTTRHNLAVTVGTSSTVGVGGQALELGIGFLARRFGYLIDNVFKYELILASGEKIIVSADSNVDLFWALKGYGANFGVVTKYFIKVHPIPELVLGGCCYFSWEDARKVIKHACEFQQHFFAIREMTLFIMLHVTNTGFQVFYRFLFSGDLAEGNEIVDRLLSSCPATILYNTIELVPYDVFQRSCDGIYQQGNFSYQHPGHFLPDVTDDYIDITLKAFGRLKPGENNFSNAYFQPLGGAIRDAPEDSSPFLYRDARFWVGLVGAANSEMAYNNMSTVINDWDRSAGSYRIKVDPEKEKHVITRLKKLKKKYDPNNVFRYNACNIDPNS